MHAKFGRRLRGDSLAFDFSHEFQVESYLDHQGTKFVERFDANSYLYITKAMDYFDLTNGHGSLAAALERSDHVEVELWPGGKPAAEKSLRDRALGVRVRLPASSSSSWTLALSAWMADQSPPRLAALAALGGYIGLPHVLGGGNWLGRFLEPSTGAHEAVMAPARFGTASTYT